MLIFEIVFDQQISLNLTLSYIQQHGATALECGSRSRNARNIKSAFAAHANVLLLQTLEQFKRKRDEFLQQMGSAQARSLHLKRSDELRSVKSDAMKCSARNVNQILSINKEIIAHNNSSTSISLSEDEYLTLPLRHKQLLEELETQCEILLMQEENDATELLEQYFEIQTSLQQLDVMLLALYVPVVFADVAAVATAAVPPPQPIQLPDEQQSQQQQQDKQTLPTFQSAAPPISQEFTPLYTGRAVFKHAAKTPQEELYFACQIGNLVKVQQLVKSGVNVNCESSVRFACVASY